MQSEIHAKVLSSYDVLYQWYKEKTNSLYLPIYSSYDVRDAGYKMANVDANIFPAGFNNICSTDKEYAPDLVKKYFKLHYDFPIKKLLLVTEEHTNNPYYWENVATLMQIFQRCDIEVKVGIPKDFATPLLMKSATGIEIQVESILTGAQIFSDFSPDLVVSNNDFSESYADWANTFSLPMNPPRELGWYQRKKSLYFKFYNQLATEFAEIVKIDPFLLRVETEEFTQFDINSDSSRSQLADRVDHVLEQLNKDYLKRNIAQKPFVFVKNNHGTYGLGVVRVSSAQEVREWTYKSRKKMKAAKGGKEIEEVIIQEGIPSVVKSDGASAEPVLYMIGCELAGGFLRTHKEKSDTESLNSPGAIYKKMCVSDLLVKPAGCPNENVYGWTAKLGLLAIGFEAQEMKISFQKYKKASC